MDARQLREAQIRDYKRGAERMGMEADMLAIEAQVVADLELVDRYEAEQKAAPPKKPKERKRDIRTDELDKYLAKHDMRAYVADGPVERTKDIIADATPKSDKAIAMFQRIKQILRPRGSIAAQAQKGRTMAESLIECSDPKLANEFLELWTWYGPLRGLYSPKNEFYWLSDGDAARKFVRGLEDICDRSTGKFGPWYTK